MALEKSDLIEYLKENLRIELDNYYSFGSSGVNVTVKLYLNDDEISSDSTCIRAN
jgi:hypothetical protein